FIASIVIMSSLTDWYSTKRIFLLSCIMTAVSSILFALFARDYLSAIIFRFLIGFSIGGTYPPGLKLIAEQLPDELKGRSMGIFIAAGSISHAISLSLTGFISYYSDVYTAFFVVALFPVIGVLLGLIALRKIKEIVSKRSPGEFKKEVLKNKPAMLMITGYSAHVWELEGMRAWTPAFLTACIVYAGWELDSAVKLSSNISSLFFIIGVFSAIIGGYLSDIIGRTKVILIMSIISIISSFIFGWLLDTYLWLVILVGFVYGFSIIADSPAYSTGLAELVAPSHLGTTLAFRSFLGFGAGALVPTAFGYILDLSNEGYSKANVAYLTNWGWAYTILGIGAIVGPIVILTLRAMPDSRRMAKGKR
ncbi:MAG: MFS transporter, partial [Nitrospirota bacterium]